LGSIIEFEQRGKIRDDYDKSISEP
jgi:hypothetical protein